MLLRTIDSLWVEHLTEVDDMRRGIGLRGYAQQDPLNEFRKEAYRLYEELSDLIRHQVATHDLPGHRPARAGHRAAARPRPAGACAARRGRRTALDGGNGSQRLRHEPRSPPPRGRAAAGAGLAAGGAALRRPDTRAHDRACRPTRCAARGRCPAMPPRRGERAPGVHPDRRPHRAQRAVLVRIGAEVQEVPRGLTRSKRGDLVRLVIVSGLAVAIVAGLATFRIWQQGDRDEQRPVDAIVVLGAAQYDGRPSPVFEARLEHAVDLWQSGIADVVRRDRRQAARRPDDRGRRRPRATRSDHGVPDDAIFGENEAHNTLDSLRAVAAEMKQRGLTSAVFVSDPTHMLRVLRIAHDLGIEAYGSPTTTSPIQQDLGRRVTRDDPRARARWRSTSSPAARRRWSSRAADRRRPRGAGRSIATRISRTKTGSTPWRERDPRLYSRPVLRHSGIGAAQPIAPCPTLALHPDPSRSTDSEGRERGSFVKQAEEAQFVDLIACERDCRNCSYAIALDCDGNCGVCPHNSYCPCVNPVVARSKTALRLIELRPILLQDLQVRD